MLNNNLIFYATACGLTLLTYLTKTPWAVIVMVIAHFVDYFYYLNKDTSIYFLISCFCFATFITGSLLPVFTFMIAICIHKYFQKENRDECENDDNTIYLIDSEIDHKFSVMDLIFPKINAFDQPQKICDQISKMDGSKMINLVLTTNGGGLTSCEKILKKLLAHKAGYCVYVRNECYSAGALLALGAKEIVMTDESYLGKVDPQLQLDSFGSPVPILIYSNITPEYYTNNKCGIKLVSKYYREAKLAKQFSKYLEQIFELIFRNNEKMRTIKSKIMDIFVYSDLPHCKLFDKKECEEIGLNVRSPDSSEEKYFSENIDDLKKK